MVYKFFSGILVESYGTWLLFQRLDDSSKDSDIPKNVPFAFAINNRNIIVNVIGPVASAFVIHSLSFSRVAFLASNSAEWVLLAFASTVWRS